MDNGVSVESDLESLQSSQRGDPNHISVLRIIAIALPLLVIGAVASEAIDTYMNAGAESQIGNFSGSPPPTGALPRPDVPPAGAMGLFVPLLLLFAAIPMLRRSWNVARGELVVVFSILVLGIPINTGAFWNHLVPAQIEMHRTRDLDRAMMISKDLWPNLGDRLENAGPEVDVNGTPAPGVRWTFHGSNGSQKLPVIDGPNGAGRCVEMLHTQDTDVSELLLELDKNLANERFVMPLTRYAVFARVRLDEPSSSSVVTLTAGVDPEQGYELFILRTRTKVEVVSPLRFMTKGRIDYQVPRDLEDKFYVKLRFEGKGKLWAKDFTIIDTEQIPRYLEGYEEATPEVWEQLSEADRMRVRLRPDKSNPVEYVKFMLFGKAPWREWSKPLFRWGLLVIAMFMAMFCLVTIFYRQWERGDRLAFPMTTFIVDLTKGDDRGRLTILRSTPFWIGGVICAVHLSLQYANKAFWPELPFVNLHLRVADVMPAGPLREVTDHRNFAQPLEVNVRPLAIAVAFFMSLEMLRSLVIFFGLAWVYRYIGYFTPLKTLPAAERYQSNRWWPYQSLLTYGGLLCMALICVIAARKHLLQVFRKALSLKSTADDSDEALTYRMAVIGLAVSVALIVWFAQLAQINPWFLLIYIGICMLLALSAARIRSEIGLPTTYLIIQWPTYLMMGFGGVLLWGMNQLVFAAQAYFLYTGTFLMIAPVLAESMAAATRVGVPLKKMGRCLIIGFLISIFVGGIVSMSWRYTIGSLNMTRQVMEKRGEFNQMTGLIEGDQRQVEKYFQENPDEDQILTEEVKEKIIEPQYVTWVVVGVSFAITGLLALARLIWLGFPLHPLGFALAFSHAMLSLWSSVAVAWAVKFVGLRFGGVQLVRRVLRPFFVGVFVSDLLTTLIWRILEAMSNAGFWS